MSVISSGFNINWWIQQTYQKQVQQQIMLGKNVFGHPHNSAESFHRDMSGVMVIMSDGEAFLCLAFREGMLQGFNFKPYLWHKCHLRTVPAITDMWMQHLPEVSYILDKLSAPANVTSTRNNTRAHYNCTACTLQWLTDIVATLGILIGLQIEFKSTSNSLTHSEKLLCTVDVLLFKYVSDFYNILKFTHMHTHIR